MKKLMQIAICIVMIWLAAIPSCKKDDEVTADQNKAPIAKAGADISLTAPSCDDRNGTATLDGSASADPDNNIAIYRWTKLSGPDGITIQTPTAAKTRIDFISIGEYAFQLTIRDAFGLTSSDIVSIHASGPAQEYDLDVTASSTYSFTDNLEDCYYSPCSYYDYTQIIGKGSFAPVGELNVSVYEYADTTALSDVHNTFLSVYGGDANQKSVGGQCSVNFKKLMRDGGGAFTGTFKAEYGTAQYCNENVFNNLPLLNVTGSLEVATGKITITIKGQIYF